MGKQDIQSNLHLNVFAGKNAVRTFLDPDQAPPLPLVEIPEELNPFAKDGVRIFAKLMNFLPLGNVKSLPAYNMLLEREAQPGNVNHLIENSSGNTVFSLAVIGRLFGIPKTKAIVSHEVTWGKLRLLQFFGTEIFVNEEPICPDPSDTNSGIHKAKKIGKTKGWFNPGQYDNEANPKAHEKWTGPQIWKQAGGDISVFCAGLGTTGTILGTSRYLKSKSSKIISVGVARKPNNPVPGVRTPNLLREIAFDWKKYVDHIYEAGTTESFEKSLALSRAGIMAGPSSGFALAGLLRFFEEKKRSGELDALRNKNGEVVAVFICPDSPVPYVEEYFEYLDASYFPKIENEELLIHNPKSKKAAGPAMAGPAIPEISAKEAYELLYSIPTEVLWQKIENDTRIRPSKNILLIDVRTDEEFEHFHLPGAKHIELPKLKDQLAKIKKTAAGKKILFVCKSGNRSGVATVMARAKKIDAWNLSGGMVEWSRLDLPRIRPNVCVTKHS